MTTTCTRRDCPYKIDGSCNHNIWNGMKCAGNEIGFHYRSQIQEIYADYEEDCKRKGEEPMPRNIYLDG